MDVVKPLLDLEAQKLIDFRVALEFFISLPSIRWADVVVFCRNTEPHYCHVLDEVLANKTPNIYDLDDNLFEVPLDTDIGRYHRAPQRLAFLSYYLQSADLVRVYSQPLLQRIQELTPRVHMVNAPLDWRLIQPPASPLARANGIHPAPVRIVYATSRIDDRLFSIFSPALKQVLQDYPQQVEVYFWGYQPDGFQNLPNVHFLKPEPNYNTFLKRFSRMGFDIGLAPLLDDTFHRSKTNNKFREYGACGIAGVYSAVNVYTSCVEDGRTGLLASNDPGAWHSALVRLIESADLRQQIGQAARQKVRELYSQEQFAAVWWQQIQAVLETPGRGQWAVGSGGWTVDGGQDAVGSVQAEKGGEKNKVLRILGRLVRSRPGELFDLLWPQVYNGWLLFKINCLESL